MDGNKQKRVAAAFARQMSIRPGKNFREPKKCAVSLIFSLLLCSTPETTADGKKNVHHTVLRRTRI